jgi:hypothetical protein
MNEKKELTDFQKWILIEMKNNEGSISEEELLKRADKWYPNHPPAPVAN